MREVPRPVARLGAFLAQVPLLPDDLDRDRLRLSAADGVGAREPRDDPVRPGVVQLRQPHGDLAVVAGRQAGRLLVPADAHHDLAAHVRDEAAGDLDLHLAAAADGDALVERLRLGGGVDLALARQGDLAQVADPTRAHGRAAGDDRSAVAVPLVAERVAVLL